MLGASPARLRELWVLRGTAMGCWRAPGPAVALLLLLCPAARAACPASCRCSRAEADCSERGLRQVPWSLWANTSSLLLGHNFITVLGPRSFPPLPALLRLSLAHNRLELIHGQALLGLGALRELDLSHNRLTLLSPDTFQPLSSLATLNLAGNRLGELEPAVLGALPQLQALLLHDNPWVCSCGILPLWRWLSLNRDKVRGECPQGVPKPPTRSPLAADPARAEGPWGEAPQNLCLGHGSSWGCSGGNTPGFWLMPTFRFWSPAGIAWQGGLGSGTVTGTQRCPQQ